MAVAAGEAATLGNALQLYGAVRAPHTHRRHHTHHHRHSCPARALCRLTLATLSSPVRDDAYAAVWQWALFWKLFGLITP